MDSELRILCSHIFCVVVLYSQLCSHIYNALLHTGRSEIMTLFDDLTDAPHTLTLTVSHEPANVWVKGHLVQVFALLSASDNLGCKNMTLV